MSEFLDNGVIMKSGATISDIDAVICCTGYQLNFEFFDSDIKE